MYRVCLESKSRAGPQKAPISVPHPEAALADPCKPLRWVVVDPRGAKGRKETCGGAEDDEVEEEVDEEEWAGRGIGEALVVP